METRHNKLGDCLIWRGCKCWYQMRQIEDERLNRETSNETYCKNIQIKHSEQCSLDTYMGIDEVDLQEKSFNIKSLKCVNYNLIVF